VQRLVATLLFAASLGTGCAISTPEDPAEPTIDPRVHVLPDVTGMVVMPASITLPRAGNEALAHFSTGDILVSTQGEGLLRRVEATELSTQSIVLSTTDAELTDALVDARLTTSLGGEGKADTHQLPTIGFSITDQQVLDNPAITAKVAKASLSFSPELDLDLALDDRHLESFEMVMRGKVTGVLDLEIDARDVAVGPEIVLWKSPPAVFYQQVGIVPVVESVTTSVVLKLQASATGHGRIRIHADALANLEAGVRYADGAGWDPVADATMTANGSVPETSLTLDTVGVRAWLAARVDVRLYGVAGPYIAAGPQVEVSRDVSGGAFHGKAGFRAATGGGLEFLRVNVPLLPSFDLLDLLKTVL
jgi:hypothetical protein